MTVKHSLTALTALAVGIAAFACGPSSAEARRPVPVDAFHSPSHGKLISVDVERPGGSSLQSYWYEGAMYVAGSQGERYNIRLTNHTGERVEAVVTVDGRDVISGKLGDFKRQRGYVLDPYGSVSIEGFRQTLSHVASFRFSDVGDSYSARRGTPQHVGVIGVAVFKEQHRHSRRRPQPVQPQPYPRRYYQPHDDYDLYGSADEESRRERYGYNRKGSGAKRKHYSPSPGGGASADASAPAAESEAAPRSSSQSAGRARRDSRGGYYGGDQGGSYREYAPPPTPQNELGTQYGETRYSSVREVEFRRNSKRKPDAMLTVYYDSMRGLRARGVPVDPPPVVYPYYDDPDPWPYARGYAPPPPRRY